MNDFALLMYMLARRAPQIFKLLTLIHFHFYMHTSNSEHGKLNSINQLRCALQIDEIHTFGWFDCADLRRWFKQIESHAQSSTAQIEENQQVRHKSRINCLNEVAAPVSLSVCFYVCATIEGRSSFLLRTRVLHILAHKTNCCKQFPLFKLVANKR